MAKFLLTVLIFVCSVSGIYSAYLLFNAKIEPIVGAILTSACVLVFIWCLSLLKKHRLEGSSIFWVFFIAVLLLSTTVAYAGVEPMSGAKDKMLNWVETKTSKITEPKPTTTSATLDRYIIPPAGFIGNWKAGNLRTLKRWEGTESRELSYQADKTPWVLNAGYKVTSQISSKFSVYISKPTQIPGVEEVLYAQETRDGISCILVEEKGNFKIHIESSGANWWVRIGTE